MKREVTSIREVTSFVLAADLHPGWIDASHRLRDRPVTIDAASFLSSRTEPQAE